MKKELAVFVFGAMLAVAAGLDAGTLLEIPGDVKLGNRQSLALTLIQTSSQALQAYDGMFCRLS